MKVIEGNWKERECDKIEENAIKSRTGDVYSHSARYRSLQEWSNIAKYHNQEKVCGQLVSPQGIFCNVTNVPRKCSNL